MNNVSVIIPVYNESFLITKVCLKLLQNLENSKIVNNFEIILVENGSTDNSAILVDKLSQENLKSLNKERFIFRKGLYKIKKTVTSYGFF